MGFSRDKLERGGKRRLQGDYYFKKYGRQIISMFRARALDKFGAEFFSEAQHYGAPIKVERRTAGSPTFWEFVQFVKFTE